MFRVACKGRKVWVTQNKSSLSFKFLLHHCLWGSNSRTELGEHLGAYPGLRAHILCKIMVKGDKVSSVKDTADIVQHKAEQDRSG